MIKKSMGLKLQYLAGVRIHLIVQSEHKIDMYTLSIKEANDWHKKSFQQKAR
jgi:hypothetical protein